MGEVGFVQRGYLALEEQGKAYRIDSEVLPSKFMNATLNEAEVGVLRRVPSGNMLRQGRVSCAPSSSPPFCSGQSSLRI